MHCNWFGEAHVVLIVTAAGDPLSEYFFRVASRQYTFHTDVQHY